jgi:hypothetical protein
MPITTYLNDNELNQNLSSKVLTELLQEMREASGVNWQIIEYKQKVNNWFYTKTKMFYSLFAPVGYEWQIINFCPEEDDSCNINTCVDQKTIINFMLGYLCATEERK